MAMRYTLTFLDEHHDQLRDLIFGVPGVEGAAFLRCGISSCPSEQRLLVRSVEAIRPAEYLVREPLRLSIASTAYARVAKRAGEAREAVVFVHSHPTGIADFSEQDDREEPLLMEFLRSRLGEKAIVGSLVISSRPSHSGRIWLDGRWARMSLMRVIGQRFRFLGLSPDLDAMPQFFDRQILAFGEDIQRVLKTIAVGVVGVGGTGSIVVAQLARLGVGTVFVFDGDTFESTNVNRVYGSSVEDQDRNKTDIQEDAVNRVGLGTRVVNVPAYITEKHAALRLRECDVVFGCTDNQRPRGILNELAMRYYIPVIDMGVTVTSRDQIIEGVYGRVTTLLPAEACLFCRDRISPGGIQAEGLDPAERRDLANEGYVPELGGNAPAVIPFTTAVATQAVSELLHRLTGFMGAQRLSTEVLMFLDQTELHTNRRTADPDCGCQLRDLWGRGDERDFLGLMW